MYASKKTRDCIFPPPYDKNSVICCVIAYLLKLWELYLVWKKTQQNIDSSRRINLWSRSGVTLYYIKLSVKAILHDSSSGVTSTFANLPGKVLNHYLMTPSKITAILNYEGKKTFEINNHFIFLPGIELTCELTPGKFT